MDLLRPFPAEEMRAWQVGSKVGNPRNNDPTLAEPENNATMEARLRRPSDGEPPVSEYRRGSQDIGATVVEINPKMQNRARLRPVSDGLEMG